MQDWIYKLQQSRNFIALIGILLVVWLGYNTTRVILRNYELVQIVDNLENEITVLQLENANLEFEIGYYSTDAFLELQARDKLSKVAKGEKVLVLPRDRYDNLVVDNNQAQTDDSPPAVSNFNAWLDFLSGGDND